MEEITIGTVLATLTVLAAGVSSAATINKTFRKKIQKDLSETLEPVNKKLEDLDERLSEVATSARKDYLVKFLADIEKGEDLDPVLYERFWEDYDAYKKSGGNSYVKVKVKKLEQEGKLSR